MLMIGENDYPNCARDYENAVKQLDEVKGSKNLVFIAGNTHEDMVLEIGTKDDEVGPPLAAFARFVTGSI